MKHFLPILPSLLLALVAPILFGQTSKPRILVLVTSADRFPSGRPTGLWLEEYAVPYRAFVEAGYAVTVVSPKGGQPPLDPNSAKAAKDHPEWNDAIKALATTQSLSTPLRIADYAAIFLPGGHGPLFDLASDPQAAALVSAFAQSGKPVATVCHGPAGLLGATLADGTPFVKGHRLTSFSDSEEEAAHLSSEVPYSVEQRLRSLGALYEKGPNFGVYAVTDGQLVTGQNPASSQKVADLLLALLHPNR